MERWKREELSRLSSIFMGSPTGWRKFVEKGQRVQVVEEVAVKVAKEDGTTEVKMEKKPVLHNGSPVYKVEKINADELLRTLSSLELEEIVKQQEQKEKLKAQETAPQPEAGESSENQEVLNAESGDPAVSSDPVRQE